MEPWMPVITLVVGFFAGGQYVRFTTRGRLLGRIGTELDLLDKLPEGEARDDLRQHVEAQVRYLVARESHTTEDERFALRRHLIEFGGIVAILALVVTGEMAGRGPFAYVLGGVGALFLFVQVTQLQELLAERSARRSLRIRAVEREPRRGASGRLLDRLEGRPEPGGQDYSPPSDA